MAAALAAELVRSLARRQLGSGLFPLVRWSGGRRDEITSSPFATTFVVHALRRAVASLESETAAEAREVIEQAVGALRRAPDPDGRVRFLGPTSAIRPDVDDTACVWLALGDAGERCPEGVLAALDGAAVEGGGFANDFDTTAPAAIEIASTTAALALLARGGRSRDAAVRYVERKTEELCAGALPSGFFFPSRFFAAFVVTRAAVDLGVTSLASSAQRLAAWVAKHARAEGPLLERSFALWVLEATAGPTSVRGALAASIDATHGDHEDEPWFTGDPRALERTGLELFGCPAVAEAIALDAWALGLQPGRRLAQRAESGPPKIEPLGITGRVARFRVGAGADEIVVEVLPAAPSVRAYRQVGAWAVRYVGRDSARGTAAADAVVAAGVARLMASPAGEPPVAGALCLVGAPAHHDGSAPVNTTPCVPCLDRPRCAAASTLVDPRPRLSDEPLADLIRFLGRSGLGSAALLDDAAALRAAMGDLAQVELEVSLKARGEALLEGPRLTFYQHQPETARVLEVFGSLGGEPARALADRLGAAVAGLPVHVGVVHGVAGRLAAKLYVRTDTADRARQEGILERCGEPLRLGALNDTWLHGIGLAVDGARVRVRAYTVVPRERVTSDPEADRHALEGWDLTADAEPSLEARYVHYRRRHLSWARASELAGLGPELSRRVGEALTRTGRWYARFFGVPTAGDARSIYVTLGPRVPRFDDDGP